VLFNAILFLFNAFILLLKLLSTNALKRTPYLTLSTISDRVLLSKLKKQHLQVFGGKGKIPSCIYRIINTQITNAIRIWNVLEWKYYKCLEKACSLTQFFSFLIIKEGWRQILWCIKQNEIGDHRFHESRPILHFNCLGFYIYIPPFTHLALLIHLSELAYAHKVAIFYFMDASFFVLLSPLKKKIVEHFGISTVYVNAILFGV